MRLRKAELRGRVNGDLELRFERSGLTSYAGLELFREWLRRIGLRSRVRRIVGAAAPRSDYGVVSMVLLVLALLISGGRRLRQLRYLDGDPAVLRFCGLKKLPAFRSVSRWLGQSSDGFVASLKALNQELTHEQIERAGLR